MKNLDQVNPMVRWQLIGDLLIILVISLIAEASHFARANGKVIINADSVQYVDNAEAMLAPDGRPDFSLRKPGYPMILALVGLLFGNMSWAAVAANHAYLALLPVGAYGFGRILRGRLTAWLAALFLVAQLQVFLYGDRILSESSYMCFLSFGLLAVLSAWRRKASMRLFLLGGILLACAWLIRSVALLAVVVAVGFVAWNLRHQHKRLAAATLCLLLPLSGAYALECSLNGRHHGAFRPSTGSFGLMLMMRARHLQGLPMTDSKEGRECLALLPGRCPDDAFRANEVDTWVARYRAVHELGLSDWQTDRLMRDAAVQMIWDNPFEFLAGSLDVFVSHLFRRDRLIRDGYVAKADRLPVVVHPRAVGRSSLPCTWQYWWAYWSLPHRSFDEQNQVAHRIHAAAGQRAPFASTVPLPILRYAGMAPGVEGVLGFVRWTASIWPVVAILACVFLRIDKRLCVFFATLYVLDAVLIAICCPSESALRRYRTIWLVTDAALSATFVSGLAALVWSRVVGRLRRKWSIESHRVSVT